MKLNPKIILTILSFTYIGFIITNIMTLSFNFQLGVKANTFISLISDIVFLFYLWIKEYKNAKIH